MKKRLFYAVLVGIFVSLPLVWGQSQPAKQEAALSAEDAKQLKDQLEALAALLKSKVPQESQGKSDTQSSQTQSQSGNRSVADVLDKALDLTSSSIAFIASKVEKAAPQVWRIMIFQQYAKAIGDVILPWGLFILVVVYYKVVGKKWIKPDKFSDDKQKNVRDEYVGWFICSRVIPICFGCIFGIWGMNNLSGSIKYLINPEYYAIKDLFGIVMGNVGM
ncbi:MAG: hypothetical protein HYV54_00230 [Parcubacteria group bacterium]|nr:hypothetical protein [Parcubacteria group bacterium]